MLVLMNIYLFSSDNEGLSTTTVADIEDYWGRGHKILSEVQPRINILCPRPPIILYRGHCSGR